MVVGQFGQSIDARIATASGHSHYINGAAGLAHLHRLRALVDAVVVGVGTAIADDPQLTVRRVAGPQPGAGRRSIRAAGCRAIARMLADDGVRRLVVTAKARRPAIPDGVEIVRLATNRRPDRAGRDPRGARRARLSPHPDRRRRRHRVSRFLAAGCLDRLHVVIAPIIIGAGPASVTLPPIARARAGAAGADACACHWATRCCSIAICALSASRSAWRRNRRDRRCMVRATVGDDARADARARRRSDRAADRRARCAALGPAGQDLRPGFRDRPGPNTQSDEPCTTL